MKVEKPLSNQRFFCFTGQQYFLGKLFELFIGKHFINHAEDSLLIFLVKLLDEPHLLNVSFVFIRYFFGHIADIVNNLVGGQIR